MHSLFPRFSLSRFFLCLSVVWLFLPNLVGFIGIVPTPPRSPRVSFSLWFLLLPFIPPLPQDISAFPVLLLSVSRSIAS
jgi:hypothetical protein